jgi:hypothetical protein
MFGKQVERVISAAARCEKTLDPARRGFATHSMLPGKDLRRGAPFRSHRSTKSAPLFCFWSDFALRHGQ